MNVILTLNLNMKYLKQKSIFSTPQCLKQITNCALKMHVKPTDRQIIYTANQNIRNFTKKSISYSQALRFRKIWYIKSDLHKNCKRLLNALTKSGYNETDTTAQINRAITITRKELLNKI